MEDLVRSPSLFVKLLRSGQVRLLSTIAAVQVWHVCCVRRLRCLSDLLLNDEAETFFNLKHEKNLLFAVMSRIPRLQISLLSGLIIF